MKIAIASKIKRVVFASLVDHAKRELELAGLFDKDSDYDGMIGKAVMKLMNNFSGQGHSGFSANWTRDLFDQLAQYKNLTPITDDPEDWTNVSEHNDKKLWQCKRNPSLFSENGGKSYYDVEDKKRKKTRSKVYKKASDKPSIFKRTIYRLPTKEELVEVDSFDLSVKEIISGFYYTMVGRGRLNKENKEQIVQSIKQLDKMFPGKYKEALKRALVME